MPKKDITIKKTTVSQADIETTDTLIGSGGGVGDSSNGAGTGSMGQSRPTNNSAPVSSGGQAGPQSLPAQGVQPTSTDNNPLEDQESQEQQDQSDSDRNSRDRDNKEKKDEDKEKEEKGEEGEKPAGEEEGKPVGENPEGKPVEGEGVKPVEGAGAGEGVGLEGAELGSTLGEGSALGATGVEAGAAGVGEVAAGGAAVAEGAAAAAETAAVAGEAAAAGTEVVAGATVATGGTCWIIGFIILVIILLLMWAIFGQQAMTAQDQGVRGKSKPVLSGKDYVNTQTVIAASTTVAKSATGQNVTGQFNLNLNATDKKFIQDGKADKRLLDILKYLSDRHLSLGISRVISGFENKNINPEAGPQNNPNTISTTSAHTEGLAADITTIDFVYKVDEESQTCQQVAAAACGPFAPACRALTKQLKLGNLVYYSDKNAADATLANTDTTLDSAATDAKIAAQKILLDQSQSTVAQAKTDLADLKKQLEQAKTNLNSKLASSSITADQRTQIQTQLARIDTIANSTGVLFNQVDTYNQQLTTYNQKIVEIGQKSAQLKKNLESLKALNNKLGPKKSASVDSSINNMLTQLNKIVPKFDSVSTQIQNATLNVSDNTQIVKTQVQGVVAAVNDTSTNDTNTYLKKVDSATKVVAVANSVTAIDSMSQGQSMLDGFAQELESLIQASANQALDQFKTQMEEQLNKAIDDKLNTAMSGLGVGNLDSTAMLTLPCVGFVVPSASSVTGVNLNIGTINGYDITKMSQDITKNINNVDARVGQASGALSNVSTQIVNGTKTVDTQMQNFSSTFASKVQSLQASVNNANVTSKNTYLHTIDQNIGLLEIVNNPTDAINQFKGVITNSSGQLASLGQGTIAQGSTSTSTVSLDSLKTNTDAQKTILSGSKTNANQTKAQLTDMLNTLKQTKDTLQAQSTNQSLTSAEKARVQAQITRVQSLIDKTNTYKNQIDVYTQQIDAVNQNITDAVQGLTQFRDDLKALKNILNPGGFLAPIKLDGLIAKFIPSAMIPYAVVPNTKYKDKPYTQAVPIQVKWQDDMPDAKYVGGATDDKSLINAPIFYSVYRPEARRKVHELIQQALQFPTDMNNQYYYHVTQLITYSDSRDVQPFMSILKTLYGLPRPANFGLFAMPEAWAQVHIAY